MKNREKHMQEIFKLIPDEFIVDRIGVNKKTNKVFQCVSSEDMKCRSCLFNNKEDGLCDYNKIYDWLNQES